MITINDIKKSVEAVAPQFPVKRIELFGSYADERNNENSDIDLLVEFMSPFTSLIILSGLKLSLEEKLKTEIDIVTLPISKQSILEIGKVVPIYES
ncbi:nucleotidyltransferase family protein [Anaerovorax odorimutans]|uniref:nucleotidyltransferase family protein n=1 Tax=Anaerovorax odorimutans TaxID=109327 RepID=UPI0004130A43|nr:nucleotidyltransferase domain-containing protein [Anaerovorax odorimutans]